jgi:hypothetical protein
MNDRESMTDASVPDILLVVDAPDIESAVEVGRKQLDKRSGDYERIGLTAEPQDFHRPEP